MNRRKCCWWRERSASGSAEPRGDALLADDESRAHVELRSPGKEAHPCEELASAHRQRGDMVRGELRGPSVSTTTSLPAGASPVSSARTSTCAGRTDGKSSSRLGRPQGARCMPPPPSVKTRRGWSAGPKRERDRELESGGDAHRPLIPSGRHPRRAHRQALVSPPRARRRSRSAAGARRSRAACHLGGAERRGCGGGARFGLPDC